MALGALILCTGSVFGRVQPGSAQPEPPRGVTPAAAASFGGEKSVTRPSRDSTLSYTFPVEIAEIVARGGAKVKKGDLLVKGRDDEYRYQRDLQKLQAESDLDIQKAQAALEQAQIEYDAQVELRDLKKGGNKLQFDQARTVLAVRKVELALAQRDHTQQIAQLGFRQAQLDRLALTAPFDGQVDTVSVEVGEVKRETEPVIRVVATDKLWIDVNTPIAQTLNLALKAGDRAWVLMDTPGGGEPKVYMGKVIEVAADANFEAGLRRVRVELDNPADWPSGLTSWVRFTAPTGEWAPRVVDRVAVAPAPGANP
jgi:multidrug efflux pump subunit AcrA (membrane-fusion protein)